jgi:hypothetical protein
MTVKDLSNRLLVVVEVIAMLVFTALVTLFAHRSDVSPHHPNSLTGQTSLWFARGQTFYVLAWEHTILDLLLAAVIGLWIVVGAWWAVHWTAFRERPDRDHWFGKFTAILVILAIVGSLAHAWYFRATG